MTTTGWVTDHPYIGNLCSGFGGETECEHRNLDTGEPCRQSPGAHQTTERATELDRLIANAHARP